MMVDKSKAQETAEPSNSCTETGALQVQVATWSTTTTSYFVKTVRLGVLNLIGLFWLVPSAESWGTIKPTSTLSEGSGDMSTTSSVRFRLLPCPNMRTLRCWRCIITADRWLLCQLHRFCSRRPESPTPSMMLQLQQIFTLNSLLLC